jgi:hypothetical protein
MFNFKMQVLRILFYGAVALCLLLTLIPYAFVTHDGPSHLYNAHIINNILFSTNSIYVKYHTFNPDWLQPNLIGYFVLCGLQLIVPFLWAEKILIALYVLTFSFGFRFFLKQVSPAPDWYALMLFPFIFNAVLFWGFFNFLLGLALTFWLMGLHEKYKFKLSLVRFLGLTVLAILVFYSHALVFVLCGVSVFIRAVSEIAVYPNKSKASFILALKPVFIFLPGSLLFLIYMYQQRSSAIMYDEGFNLFNRLSRLWLQIDSLSFSGYAEGNYIKLFYAVLLALAVLKIFMHWKNRQSILSPAFILFGIIFLMYLFLPDYAAGGGIISIRINLLLFLFWVTWLSTGSITTTAKYLITVFYLIGLPFFYLRWEVIAAGSRQCKQVIELSDSLIPANAVISTVHYKNVRGFTGNYQIHSYIDLMSNLDNYIAIKHNAVTLHNYEAGGACGASYFPVIWKNCKSTEYVWDPVIIKGKLEYFKLEQFERNWNHQPDFLLSIGSLEQDEKTKCIWDTKNNYSLLKTDSLHFMNIYGLNSQKK